MPTERFRIAFGNCGTGERVVPTVQPPAPGMPWAQGEARVVGVSGEDWCCEFTRLRTVEPVAPGLQPGVLAPERVPAPEVLAGQGAACAAGGVAASSSSATRQPARAGNNDAMTTTARGKRDDRSVMGMRRGPFGAGAGLALMLPGTVGAELPRRRPFCGAH